MAFNFQYSKKFSKKLPIFYILLFTSICSIPFFIFPIYLLNTQTNGGPTIGGESGGASTVEDWIIKSGLSPDKLRR